MADLVTRPENARGSDRTVLSAPAVEPPDDAAPRSAGAFTTRRAARRYAALVTGLVVVAVALTVGYLLLDNPGRPGTTGHALVTQRRAASIAVIAVVALCQGLATVAFHTVTGNRIVTPAILGVEALYVTVQTGAVYLLGITGVVALQGVPQLLLQIAVMVALAVGLFSWLLSGRLANLHVMLLVGVVIGTGLRSVSSFMQRLLTPSEFDVLTARMFGSVANADASYLPVVVPLALTAGALLLARARRLDVLALGPAVATALGVEQKRESRIVLTLVAVLVAVSTALVGPMTFLGFLAATLAYQAVGTFSHRHVMPVAALTAFVTLTGAYVVLKHVFAAQGAVSIIVELVGGTVFLVVLLRKGRL